MKLTEDDDYNKMPAPVATTTNSNHNASNLTTNPVTTTSITIKNNANKQATTSIDCIINHGQTNINLANGDMSSSSMKSTELSSNIKSTLDYPKLTNEKTTTTTTAINNNITDSNKLDNDCLDNNKAQTSSSSTPIVANDNVIIQNGNGTSSPSLLEHHNTHLTQPQSQVNSVVPNAWINSPGKLVAKSNNQTAPTPSLLPPLQLSTSSANNSHTTNTKTLSNNTHNNGMCTMT